MLFMNKKGQLEELDVYVKPASKIVRQEVFELEKDNKMSSIKFGKRIAKEYPDLFEAENNSDVDLAQLLIDEDSVKDEDVESILTEKNKLDESQLDTMLKQIKVIVDVDKTRLKNKKIKGMISQLESDLGETTNVIVGTGEDAEEKEFDFWDNQDLEILMEQKVLFFRRTRIGL